MNAVLKRKATDGKLVVSTCIEKVSANKRQFTNKYLVKYGAKHFTGEPPVGENWVWWS